MVEKSEVEKSGVGKFMVEKSWVGKSGVGKFMVESPGLKGLGLKFGVEKSGVEMSFNRHFYIDINYMDRALMPNIFTPLPKSKNNKIFSPILGWHC